MSSLGGGALGTWSRRTWQRSGQATTDLLLSALPQAVAVTVGIVTSALIARGLGPAGYGRLALATSLSMLAISLADLGLGQTAIRFAAREASHHRTADQLAVLRWTFRLRLLTLASTAFVLQLAAPLLARWLWNDGALTPLLRLGLTAGGLTALAAVPSLYYLSARRFGANAVAGVGQRLVYMAGIGWLAWLGWWTELRVMGVTAAAAAISALVLLGLVPRRALWKPGELPVRALSLRRLLANPLPSDGTPGRDAADALPRFAAYNLVSTVLVVCTIQADVWLIGHFLGSEQLGLYSAAARFALPLTVLRNAMNTSLWPRASACTDVGQTRALAKRMVKIAVGVSALALVYALSVPLLAPWLFGSRYAQSTLLGQALCARHCLAMLAAPIGIIGYNVGMVRAYCGMNLLQLLLVVSANCLLLPRIGAFGSVVALVASDLVGLATIGLVVGVRLANGRGRSRGA